ncbi:hypothetical protein EAW52_11000 [Pseudomonas sp. LTJR-52]|nr:hypothetical protein EAW52_11000 [Pseudomonas sp. LTJR-52]
MNLDKSLTPAATGAEGTSAGVTGVTTLHRNNSSTDAMRQRQRLLNALIELGAVNTLFARDKLNCMAPAPRIKELRALGHEIYTDRITINDRDGRTHKRVARYVLLKLAKDAVI